MNQHAGPLLARRQIKTKNGTVDAKVIDCQTCGYAHLDPLPALEELGQFYSYHFYEKQKPDYLEKMERESNYWLSVYEWRLNIYKKLIQSRGFHVLDIGSSGGFFLAAAKKLGAEVFGIEPSDKAADYCREKFGIDVSVNIYEEAELAKQSFDIIHSSLVIEHLHDPQHFIEWSTQYMKPGGLFVVETPHEFNEYQNILVKKMGYEPWFVAFPDHLNYFTQDSLTRTVEKRGFKKVKSLCTFPMEQFVLEGMDYLKDSTWGLKCHQARMQFELNLIKAGAGDLLERTYSSWAENNVGRTQILIFQKI